MQPADWVDFPVGSDLPSRDESIDLSSVADALNRALTVTTATPSLGGAVRDALAALSQSAHGLANVLGRPQSAEATNDERAAFTRARPQLSEDQLVNFAVYDRYFGVRRIADQSMRALAATAFDAWSAAFADIRDVLLARDEIIALLRACAAMTSRIGSTTPRATAAPAPLPVVQSTDETQRALLRWRTGHHVFGLCAMHARDAVLHADFQTAATFVRALASAMWYASEFPIGTYLSVMRPAMEQSGARGGFSGTQNPDYMRLTWAREQAVEELFTRYGTDAAAWPPDLYTSLMFFNEMETQMAEQHVLVAASKVAADNSLAQKAAGDRSPAVQALREIATAVEKDVTERFTARGAQRVRACALSDVPPERPLGLRLNGRDIVICRTHGALWACAGLCTHAGGELDDGHIAGDVLVCPIHGAEFDPRTGRVVRGPATEALATYDVDIEGSDVYVELP